MTATLVYIAGTDRLQFVYPQQRQKTLLLMLWHYKVRFLTRKIFFKRMSICNSEMQLGKLYILMCILLFIEKSCLHIRFY